MKKPLSLFLVIALCCLVGAACAKKAASPQAGSAKGEDMLSLFPKDTRGLIVVDVHRIMQTEAAAKAIKDNEKNEKYAKFVQETGIDPQKDVFFFAGAMMGDIGQNNPDGAADRQPEVRQGHDPGDGARKSAGELTTSDYNGITVYQVPGGEDKKPFERRLPG